MFFTLHRPYRSLLSSIFWITGEFITLNAFTANFVSSHRPLIVLSAASKTIFTTTLTTASYQYISSYISSSFVLGIIEMPLLLRIPLSGLDFLLVKLRNVQIMLSLPFFLVMIKQSIFQMPRKRNVQSHMLLNLKLCALNGMVVFC